MSLLQASGRCEEFFALPPPRLGADAPLRYIFSFYSNMILIRIIHDLTRVTNSRPVVRGGARGARAPPTFGFYIVNYVGVPHQLFGGKGHRCLCPTNFKSPTYGPDM